MTVAQPYQDYISTCSVLFFETKHKITKELIP